MTGRYSSTSGRSGAALPHDRPSPEGDLGRARRQALKIVKLNVDENLQVTQRYSILAIPTLSIFRDGELHKQIKGAKPKAALLRDLAEYV